MDRHSVATIQATRADRIAGRGRPAEARHERLAGKLKSHKDGNVFEHGCTFRNALSGSPAGDFQRAVPPRQTLVLRGEPALPSVIAAVGPSLRVWSCSAIQNTPKAINSRLATRMAVAVPCRL